MGFDASPLAHDRAAGMPFGELIANHLFAEAGEDLKLFHGITFSYGHNIEMEDRRVVQFATLASILRIVPSPNRLRPLRLQRVLRHHRHRPIAVYNHRLHDAAEQHLADRRPSADAKDDRVAVELRC